MLGMGGYLNLYGYVVVKKVITSFNRCGQGRAISRSDLKCAFKVLSKKRMLTDSDGYEVFKINAYLSQGIDRGYDQFLDFREFFVLGAAHIIYSEFGFIINNEKVNRKEMLIAIDEGKLPSFFDRDVINIIYDNKEYIDYG